MTVLCVQEPVSHPPAARRDRARYPRVLLVSRSPRRRSLLSQHGVEFEAVHPGFEDSVLEPGSVSPRQWVASLAYLKAWAGAVKARERTDADVVVIGADTACVMDGALIGTPRDEREAESMIRSFLGREHTVLTGVALLDVRSHNGPLAELDSSRRRMLVESARVRVGRVDDRSVREYVASRQWQGKAGAYNLAERLDAGWPIEYDGDPTTIMGLPMRALLRRLDELQLASLQDRHRQVDA